MAEVFDLEETKACFRLKEEDEENAVGFAIAMCYILSDGKAKAEDCVNHSIQQASNMKLSVLSEKGSQILCTFLRVVAGLLQKGSLSLTKESTRTLYRMLAGDKGKELGKDLATVVISLLEIMASKRSDYRPEDLYESIVDLISDKKLRNPVAKKFVEDYVAARSKGKHVLPTEFEARLLEAQAAKVAGNWYYNKEKYPQALVCYDLAIEATPTETGQECAIYWSNRAATNMKLYHFEEAVEDCTRALKSFRFPKALARRSKAYEQLSRPKEAIQDAREYVDLCPDDVDEVARLRSLETIYGNKIYGSDETCSHGDDDVEPSGTHFSSRGADVRVSASVAPKKASAGASTLSGLPRKKMAEIGTNTVGTLQIDPDGRGRIIYNGKEKMEEEVDKQDTDEEGSEHKRRRLASKKKKKKKKKKKGSRVTDAAPIPPPPPPPPPKPEEYDSEEEVEEDIEEEEEEEEEEDDDDEDDDEEETGSTVSSSVDASGDVSGVFVKVHVKEDEIIKLRVALPTDLRSFLRAVLSNLPHALYKFFYTDEDRDRIVLQTEDNLRELLQQTPPHLFVEVASTANTSKDTSKAPANTNGTKSKPNPTPSTIPTTPARPPNPPTNLQQQQQNTPQSNSKKTSSSAVTPSSRNSSSNSSGNSHNNINNVNCNAKSSSGPPTPTHPSKTITTPTSTTTPTTTTSTPSSSTSTSPPMVIKKKPPPELLQTAFAVLMDIIDDAGEIELASLGVALRSKAPGWQDKFKIARVGDLVDYAQESGLVSVSERHGRTAQHFVRRAQPSKEGEEEEEEEESDEESVEEETNKTNTSNNGSKKPSFSETGKTVVTTAAVVEPKTPTPPKPPLPKDQPLSSSSSSASQEKHKGKKESGVVEQAKETFGFVRKLSDPHQYFFHATQVEGPMPRVGDRVTFRLAQNPKTSQLNAVDLHIVVKPPSTMAALGPSPSSSVSASPEPLIMARTPRRSSTGSDAPEDVLVEMGFDREQAVQALRQSGYVLEDAIARLSSLRVDGDEWHIVKSASSRRDGVRTNSVCSSNGGGDLQPHHHSRPSTLLTPTSAASRSLLPPSNTTPPTSSPSASSSSALSSPAPVLSMTSSPSMSSQVNMKGNSSPWLYKTKICKRWSELGYCDRAADCWFAHGDVDLRIPDINALQTTPSPPSKSPPQSPLPTPIMSTTSRPSPPLPTSISFIPTIQPPSKAGAPPPLLSPTSSTRSPSPHTAIPVLSLQQAEMQASAMYTECSTAASVQDAITKMYWILKRINSPPDHPRIIGQLIMVGRLVAFAILDMTARALVALHPKTFTSEQIEQGLSEGVALVVGAILQQQQQQQQQPPLANDRSPKHWLPIIPYCCHAVVSRVLPLPALYRVLAPLVELDLAAEIVCRVMQTAVQDLGEFVVREAVKESKFDIRNFFSLKYQRNTEYISSFLKHRGLWLFLHADLLAPLFVRFEGIQSSLATSPLVPTSSIAIGSGRIGQNGTTDGWGGPSMSPLSTSPALSPFDSSFVWGTGPLSSSSSSLQPLQSPPVPLVSGSWNGGSVVVGGMAGAGIWGAGGIISALPTDAPSILTPWATSSGPFPLQQSAPSPGGQQQQQP